MAQEIEITVGRMNSIHVRVTTDGKHHRHVIMPGQSYANEHPDVQKVCEQEHTQQNIDAYESLQRNKP